MEENKPRYCIAGPWEKQCGYRIVDSHNRRSVAVIFEGGPGDLPAHRIAVRLARWLNCLAAIEAENEQLRQEEEGS